MRRPARPLERLVAALALPLAAAVVLGQSVPLPDLEGSEERVREKIQRLHERVMDDPSDGQAWGQYAMTLEAHRHLAEAAEAYREAHRLDGDTFEWPYYLAVLLDYEDPAAARRWHLEALKIDDRYAPGHVRFAETLEKLGEHEEARRHFALAAELDPEEELAHFGLGRRALAEGDLESALRHLRRAYQLAPTTQSIVATLARAEHRAGRSDSARELAAEARDLPRMTHHHDPRRARIRDEAVNIESYLFRSRTYREVGQLDRALRELETLLEIEPEMAEAHFAAAGLYDRMGRAAEALASARRALELDPGFPGARPVLAGALFKLERYAEAEAEARRVLAGDPDDFHMLVLRALLDARRDAVGPLLQALDRAFEARGAERELRLVLRTLLIDVSESLAAVGGHAEAARLMDQVVQMAVEEGLPESEIESHRRKAQGFRQSGG